ncbi:27869_t:CDS:2, partial [Racocetra persica]
DGDFVNDWDTWMNKKNMITVPTSHDEVDCINEISLTKIDPMDETFLDHHIAQHILALEEDIEEEEQYLLFNLIDKISQVNLITITIILLLRLRKNVKKFIRSTQIKKWLDKVDLSIAMRDVLLKEGFENNGVDIEEYRKLFTLGVHSY